MLPHFASTADRPPPRGPRLVLPFLVLLLVSCSAQASPPARGIIISTHTDGGDWASPSMRETMQEIADLGADWVAIHPYSWIRGDARVRFRSVPVDDLPAHIGGPIEIAHDLGLKILIKPHIGYWGSPFSWRGDIAFEDDDSWSVFFDTYTDWIVNLAQACRGADGFVVGTELDSTLAHEDEWRRIITAVREVTDAPLTYAANWTHYDDVPFWDALDVIGIQAYFPLTEAPDPDPALLHEAWSRRMTELRAYSREHDRPIVFTELGYNRAFEAPVRPWAYRTDGPEAERVQAACLAAALRAAEEEPVIRGVFLWKWFPNPRPVGRNFQLATPVIRGVIRDAWTR